MHALRFIDVIKAAVVLTFSATMPSDAVAHAHGAHRVERAQDPCLIKRSARHRGQVERPVALRVGTSWPKDWREVTWPIFLATPTDSMVAVTLGVRPPGGNVESTFPREWAAFVVDTSGNVVACSFGSHDGLAADAPLARQLAQRQFAPAEVAGRRVAQLVVLERRR
jgi:hypothetical protein